MDITWLIKIAKGVNLGVDDSVSKLIDHDRALKGDFHIENNILDIKNKELNNIKRNHISICEIKKGTRNIFIPQSKALYYALLVNYNTNDYLCQYILDLNTLDDNTKELLYNNELIVIGEIDEINSKEDTVYVVHILIRVRYHI